VEFSGVKKIVIAVRDLNFEANFVIECGSLIKTSIQFQIFNG
jgi:hypothetical protein